MKRAVTIGITFLLLLAAGCSSQPTNDNAGERTNPESTVSIPSNSATQALGEPTRESTVSAPSNSATQAVEESTPASTVSRSSDDSDADIVNSWVRITTADEGIWTEELEFLADGIVVFGKDKAAAEYSFPEEGRIMFEGPNLLQIYRFSTSGNNLTFDDDGVEVTYQRVPTSIRFVRMWGGAGNGTGQFEGPGGMAVDGSGNVYVADGGNDRVQKFRADGEFLTMWGSEGNSAGQFDSPRRR